MSDLIQVVTYNIHKGFSPGKVKFNLPEMKSALDAISPDIVFLQEVLGEHKIREKIHKHWPDDSQCKFLAENLWPHYAYGKNAIYQSGHHGNAILSKHKLIGWENINVANSPRASRSLLHGVIELNNAPQTLHLLCIHLGLFKKERHGQINSLVSRIQQSIPENEPLIVAGDFNDWQIDYENALETELGLTEVFKELEGQHAKSFPAWRPTLRTDRIYYRGLTLTEGSCLKDKQWKLLSDHLPLMARFRV